MERTSNIEKMKTANKAAITFVQKQWKNAFALIFVLSLLFSIVENLAQTKTIWLEKYLVILLAAYLSTMLFALGKIVPELEAIASTVKVVLDACLANYIKMIEAERKSGTENQ